MGPSAIWTKNLFIESKKSFDYVKLGFVKKWINVLLVSIESPTFGGSKKGNQPGFKVPSRSKRPRDRSVKVFPIAPALGELSGDGKLQVKNGGKTQIGMSLIQGMFTSANLGFLST